MTDAELLVAVAERISQGNDIMAQYAAALANNAANVAEWQEAMRVELKNAYIQLAELGKGGRDLMTAADWGRVGGDLADQYKYLQGFSEEIAAGKLSEGQIAYRINMYGEATKEAYWSTWGTVNEAGDNPDLPLLTQTPGDGGTQCLTNCNCNLTSENDGVHWNLNDGEHCNDCVSLSQGGPYRLA